MRSLEDWKGEISARGVRIVAISVDPPEVTREHAARMGFTATFLSDPDARAIRAFDLLHREGAMGIDISRPAEFLVDDTGTIRWVNLTGDYRVRLRPEQLLATLDALGRGPRP